MMPELTDVEMRFAQPGGAAVQAMAPMSLTVPEGQLVAILGPSGCGKTTRLSILAGFLKPSGGRGAPARFRRQGGVFAVGRDAAARGAGALTREKMQNLILKLWKVTGKTIILITHTVQEALLLGERVIVMAPRPGRITRHLRLPIAKRGGTTDLREVKRDPGFAEARDDILSLIWGAFTGSKLQPLHVPGSFLGETRSPTPPKGPTGSGRRRAFG